MPQKDEQFSPAGDVSNPFSHAGQKNPKPSKIIRRLQVGAATLAGAVAGAGLGEFARQNEIVDNQKIVDNANRIIQQEPPSELSPTEQEAYDLSRSMDVNAAHQAKEKIDELNDPATVAKYVGGGAAAGGLLVGGGFAAATRRRRDQTISEPSK